MAVIRSLNVADIHNIAQSIEYRQLQFNETLEMSVGVVLANYGDRDTQVRCIEGEWEGTKRDLPMRDGVPLCPNDHPLFEVSAGGRIVLITGTF